MHSDPPQPRFIVVPAGPATHRALAEAVRDAKGSDPLDPVTVVVPNNFVGIAARRELAASPTPPAPAETQAGRVYPSGIAGVDFVTPFRVAELFGSASLSSRGLRPVSTPVVAAAVRQVLRVQPGYFERVRDHPTTERRLVNSHRELSELAEAELTTLADVGFRAAEVVRVHRAVCASLSDRWYTEQDLVRSAVATIEAQPELTNSLGSLVVFLPDTLAPSQATMLRALAAVVAITVIVGTTGNEEADSSLLTMVSQLSSNEAATTALASIEAATVGLPTGIESLSVSDADDEIRHVVRGLSAAAQAGVPYD
ncbi:MAG: hypothetical protein ACR2PK_01450, partial [Acidimicrobiales bacterium]